MKNSIVNQLILTAENKFRIIKSNFLILIMQNLIILLVIVNLIYEVIIIS